MGKQRSLNLDFVMNYILYRRFVIFVSNGYGTDADETDHEIQSVKGT